MRVDGESREQQQQWRGRRCWGRRRGGGRAVRGEPAALPEEAAAVGQLLRQDVPRLQEAGVLLAHAVPLQGGLHRQHRLPHVRLQGGCTRLHVDGGVEVSRCVGSPDVDENVSFAVGLRSR